MDKFLTYIERFKFAILGTVIFHFVVFMTSNFVTVDRAYNSQYAVEQPTEVELETDDMEIDEELLEMLNLQNQLNNAPLYNLTADQNDQRQKSYENFSTQELDEQIEKDARELEKQYFKEWAESHPKSEGASENSLSMENDNEKEPKPNQQNDLKNSVDNSGENAFAGRVMVSFNLKDRKAHSLKIPGYTCYGSGTVVVDIKVDKNGDVKSASYSPSKSSGATECMVQKAEGYARRARFDFSSDSGGMADGTITYIFQGQ
ncbi:hypothetical protein N8987_00100 [Crocinitomix sp.]|nr:hypothetical protein [Crocinitomix sp.]